jgi:hypothetical protein
MVPTNVIVTGHPPLYLGWLGTSLTRVTLEAFAREVRDNDVVPANATINITITI